MYRALLCLSTVIWGVLTPVAARADDDKAEAIKGINEVKRTQSLKHTQQRLHDLINAAVNQNLVDMRGDKHNRSRAVKTVHRLKNRGERSVGIDCDADPFFFPKEARIQDFTELQSLKNTVVNGRGIIDPVKIKMLAMAYLGLGFGEEALLASTVLKGQEKLAIEAMANTLIGTARPADINFTRAYISCNNNAQIWYDLLEENISPLTGVEIKDRDNELASLPYSLQQIFGLRLGLKALEAGDIPTAKAQYESLLKFAPKQESAQPITLKSDLRFFEAMLIINDGNSAQIDAAIATLKFFAKKDNPHQVRALQMLATHRRLDNSDPRNSSIYPGYEQDLDAAVQTYSHHEMGQQVLAQKVIYLAETQALGRAVALAKNSFKEEGHYFQDSVIAISKFVHVGLNSNDANRQIWALDVLMRETEFFTNLETVDDLNQAGVAVCARLALPELAAHIIPKNKWHELDVETQTLLALSLVDDTYSKNIERIFSKEILSKTELKALAIERAFTQNNPNQAVKILNTAPKNNDIKAVFINQSWLASYWSLVDKNNYAKQILSTEERNLVAELSVNSALIARPNVGYDIANLNYLQVSIKKNLSVFQAYLRPDVTQKQSENLAEEKQADSNG